MNSVYPSRGYCEEPSVAKKGFAVKTGMMEAKGDLRMFMDADYSVPIEALPQFIEAHIEGFDIIIGSRGHSDSIIEKHQKYFLNHIIFPKPS